MAVVNFERAVLTAKGRPVSDSATGDMLSVGDIAYLALNHKPAEDVKAGRERMRLINICVQGEVEVGPEDARAIADAVWKAGIFPPDVCGFVDGHVAWEAA